MSSAPTRASSRAFIYLIGKTFSRSSEGRGMTCTPISSPTRRAAAAPASVAALTEPTSPRINAVTSPASTFCQLTSVTLAVLSIASAASIMPIRPRVSIMPRASPMSALSCATGRILPSLALAKLRDMRQVMVRMPGILLEQLIERHFRAQFRVDERARELIDRHSCDHRDPSPVDAVEETERHLDGQLHVRKQGEG